MKFTKNFGKGLCLVLLFLVIESSFATSAPSLSSLEKRIRTLETKIIAQEGRFAEQQIEISSLKSSTPRTARLYFVSPALGVTTAICRPPSWTTNILEGDYIVSAVYGDRSGKVEKNLIDCNMEVLVP